MKIRDIYNAIDSFAPFAAAASWDNSGLLIGDPDTKTDRILCCLDLSPAVAHYAAEIGAGCVVSHHPVIFHPLKSVSFQSPVSLILREGIAVISAHTNLDIAPGGVNDTLCDLIGMDYEKCGPAVADGFLNFGEIPGIRSAEQMIRHLSQTLGGAVRCGDPSAKVRRFAVCAGAGADFFREAVELGCDAYLTGDADHHEFLDAAEFGLTLFAAGHYETEAPVVPVLAERLNNAFPEAEIFVASASSPIYTYLPE